jgi:Fe-S cluster biogenesis protein NfuA
MSIQTESMRTKSSPSPVLFTEKTPNPNALKFISGLSISNTAMHFLNEADAINSFLARKLLNIKGIERVSYGSDFITVSKKEDGNWDILRLEVTMIITDHFASGLGAFDREPQPQDRIIQDVFASEIEQQIAEIIETRVRPNVAMDGGDIIYRSFEDGVVKVELFGACAGCPSSIITLKNGIESMLKHYVPEVKEVQAINND